MEKSKFFLHFSWILGKKSLFFRKERYLLKNAGLNGDSNISILMYHKYNKTKIYFQAF